MKAIVVGAKVKSDQNEQKRVWCFRIRSRLRVRIIGENIPWRPPTYYLLIGPRHSCLPEEIANESSGRLLLKMVAPVDFPRVHPLPTWIGESGRGGLRRS